MEDQSVSEPLQVSRRTVVAASAAVAVAASVASQITTAPRAMAAGGELRVSSLGHDPVDSTDFLQAALDSDAKTVIIDKVPGGWITRPLFLRRSDVRIVVEPDVTVKAKVGGFPGANDCLLTAKDVSNIVISGYGAAFTMHKGEYTTGEWRMALSLLSVTNAVIEGLTFRDTGGDGVYLGRGATPTNTNVTLRDITCDNARRNGLSVISADGLTIEGCRFANTIGTNPQAGIDFEPNFADNSLSNIKLTDCYVEKNLAYALLFSLGKMDGTSKPVDITVNRSTIAGFTGDPRQLPSAVFLTSARNGVQVKIEVADSLIRMNPGSAVIGAFNSDADTVHMSFTRDTIWDWGNAKQVNEPIVANCGLLQHYGGMTFTDSILVSDLGGPQIKAYGNGVANFAEMHGKLTIVDPYDIGMNTGDTPPYNVDLALQREPEGRRAEVGVSTNGRVTGGKTTSLTFTRKTNDLATSLAIAYNLGGSARERYDYGGLGRVAVIPARQKQVTVPVRTFARRQASDPRTRDLIVSIEAGHRYISNFKEATITIAD